MRGSLSDGRYGQGRGQADLFQMYRMRYLRKGMSDGHPGDSGEIRNCFRQRKNGSHSLHCEKYKKHPMIIDLDDFRVFFHLCPAMRTTVYNLIFLNKEASDVVAASASGSS